MLVSTIDKMSMSFWIVNKYWSACGLREVTLAIKRDVPILGLSDSIDFLNLSCSVSICLLYGIGAMFCDAIQDSILLLHLSNSGLAATLQGASLGGEIPCNMSV